MDERAQQRLAVITSAELTNIRNKALRQRVWFKILGRTERAIINLTVRSVKKIRSPVLAKIVWAIVIKLDVAMKSRVERMMEAIGDSLAQRTSQIAQSWGNMSAIQWVNSSFIRYLTVMRVNMPSMFLV